MFEFLGADEGARYRGTSLAPDAVSSTWYTLVANWRPRLFSGTRRSTTTRRPMSRSIRFARATYDWQRARTSATGDLIVQGARERIVHGILEIHSVAQKVSFTRR